MICINRILKKIISVSLKEGAKIMSMNVSFNPVQQNKHRVGFGICGELPRKFIADRLKAEKIGLYHRHGAPGSAHRKLHNLMWKIADLNEQIKEASFVQKIKLEFEKFKLELQVPEALQKDKAELAVKQAALAARDKARSEALRANGGFHY